MIQILGINDVVALLHAGCLVPRSLHADQLRYASVPHVSHRRLAQIMEVQICNASRLAGLFLGPPEILDPFTLPADDRSKLFAASESNDRN